MFYEKITALCAKKGMTVNALTNELNYSNATATKWKSGSKPRYRTLLEIARFFDVDVEYLADDDYMDYDQWLSEVKGMTRVPIYNMDGKWRQDEPPAKSDTLDEEFVLLAKKLTPAQRQRVMDFMRGVLS